jgi:lauroyl/myristoyl acyltransferase
MRPAGEVRLALIQAARDIVAEIGQPQRGATLAEMVARARIETGQGVMQVSSREARNLVPKLKQAGVLHIVAERKVDYRNRPVAEYAPADLCEPTVGEGWVDLGHCMADWVR